MNFNRFVTGFIIGNLVGMAGTALTSKDTRKSLAKGNKEWMVKVGHLVDDIVDMYK